MDSSSTSNSHSTVNNAVESQSLVVPSSLSLSFPPITTSLEPFIENFLAPLTLSTPSTSLLLHFLQILTLETEILLSSPSTVSLALLVQFSDRSTLILAALMDRAKAGVPYSFVENEPPWTGSAEAWEKREDVAEDKICEAYERASVVVKRARELLDSREEDFQAQMKIARAVQDVETRRLKEESGRLEEGIKKAEEEIRESLRTIACLMGFTGLIKRGIRSWG